MTTTRSATVGSSRVTYAGRKGFTVHGRAKGGRWVREAWFARAGGVEAYASGLGLAYGQPVREALAKAIERWDQQAREQVGG